MRIYDKIRETLDNTPGLTQRGLAEHMGLDPAAVNRMMYGRRKISVEEIPQIEAYLGITLSLRPIDGDMPTQNPSTNLRGVSDSATAPRLTPPAHAQIPVYSFSQDGRKLIDWTDPHPQQIGLDGAFAMYVDDSLMEPRYYPGELVYLHPGRPLQSGRDALVDLGQGAPFLCRVKDVTGDGFIVDIFKPQQQQKISRSEVNFAYTVIGRG